MSLLGLPNNIPNFVLLVLVLSIAIKYCIGFGTLHLVLSGLKAHLYGSANLLSELNSNTAWFRGHCEIKALYFTQINTGNWSMRCD